MADQTIPTITCEDNEVRIVPAHRMCRSYAFKRRGKKNGEQDYEILPSELTADEASSLFGQVQAHGADIPQDQLIFMKSDLGKRLSQLGLDH